MPVTIHPESDAFKILNNEGVWIIPSSDPSARLKPHLKIGLMNLMPVKPPTETQIYRMMGRAPVHVDLTLFVPDSYAAKNTSPEYLSKFYKRWSEVKSEKFDGFIMTGAPIETLPFEEVAYWNELKSFFERVRETDASLLSLCWGAMASLYYFHQVPKYITPRKQFGVYSHANLEPTNILMQGLGGDVGVPVSRHTRWDRADIEPLRDRLQLVLDSRETGPCLVWDGKLGHAHMINHLEYDADTLHGEYVRDRAKGTPTGEPIHVPHGYYPSDDPAQTPQHAWKSAGQVFYSNWLSAVLRRKAAGAPGP